MRAGPGVVVGALVVLAVVAGGTVIVTGAGFPLIGGADDGGAEVTPTPSPTPTPTATPTPTPTPTATPTPMPTPTPTPEPSDLKKFKAGLRDRLGRTMQNETLTDVPVLAMEYRETEKGITELWLVYRQCDRADEISDQRFTVGAEFANTAGDFEGHQPDRLRAYAVDRVENFPDQITHIPTSSAEKVHDRTISISTYSENWNRRMREPTDSEKAIAFQMTVNESGRSTAATVFNEEYNLTESEKPCPTP